jgi:hypothetical protein
MFALVNSLSVDEAMYWRSLVRMKSVLKGESHLIVEVYDVCVCKVPIGRCGRLL